MTQCAETKTTHADERLAAEIRREAARLGFELCRFTPAALPPETGAQLRAWLDTGAHGAMEWMATTAARRADPRFLWPEARSVVMLGLNYGPRDNPLEILARPDVGAISVYARHRDYHDVIKGRLKQLAAFMLKRAGRGAVKVFVDTAPVMEKPLAAQAGLGWQGKHTNLVSRDFGSWLFLGAIFTDLSLPPDASERDHCGQCRQCLDICPTGALPAPYRIDARRCVSYLTIENPGPIPPEFRAAIGNRIYGCDDCLAVCPWNKFAQTTREAKLAARVDLDAPPLAELARLDDSDFRAFFSASPIKRIGRARFLRNVLVAIGNSGVPALAVEASRLLDDPHPLIRGAAIWALAQLAPAHFVKLRAERAAAETDAAARAEWAIAPGPAGSAVGDDMSGCL